MSMAGRSHTPEARQKASNALKGRPKSAAHKAAISKAHERAHPPFTCAYNCLRDRHPAGETIITFEDFLEFTRCDSCHYCGAKLTWIPRNSGRYNLDRKDNNRGYVKDNLLPCCDRCNKGKGDRFTYEEWFAMTAVLRNNK